jgi:two-component system, sporulation sensor kinase E
MTVSDEHDLPGAPPRPTVEAGTLRDVLIVVGMLLVIALLQLFTDPAQLGPQMLYRRLYYLPILYAAFVFGVRGGLATALAASVLFGLQAEANLGGLLGTNIDNLYEIFVYIAVGSLFGWLRDVEAVRTQQLREVSMKLEEAYGKLEERAVQLINIQEYTQSILRSITAGVITVGPEGSVATANPAAERMLGMAEEEMVPRTIASLLSDDGGLGVDVRKVLSGRLPRCVRELTLTSRAGKVIHVQASTSRMRDMDGRILGAVVTIEDVSEIKALTQQLIRADRLAAMGELTAGVAHEVRNPLGIIRASMQLVEDPRSDPERVREAGSIIKHEIDRLDKVIKALLDFGRPSSPTLLRVNIEDVLDEVVLFTRRFASRSSVSIEEHFAGDVPDVLADPNQLKQVFVNLITNAVQAMEPGGGSITVSTGASDGFVFARLADDGPGIPTEQLAKVFDPFFSTRDEGTGLGLTIVHRIVDEHDGHIEAESAPGQGTSFSVFIPAAEAETATGTTHPAATSGTT